MKSLLNPALTQLMRMRTLGRVRMIFESFRNPRKMALSILGAALALIWLGNAVASVILRESYSPESLRFWLTTSLTIYALWHLIRVTWQKPEASLDGNPQEREWLLASPFSRQELIQYRLFSVLCATTVKAAIGTVLLLPDLPHPELGFVGLWSALAMIELIRVSCDVIAIGLGGEAYQSLRAMVIVTGASLLSLLSVRAMDLTQLAQSSSELPTFVLFLKNSIVVLKSWMVSPVGIWISSPFLFFIDLIMMQEYHWSTAVMLLASAVMISAMLTIVLWVDRISSDAIRKREQDPVRIAAAIRAAEESDAMDDWHLPSRLTIRVCGGLFWRQLVGLYRHRTGALIAFLPPAILSAMPLFMRQVSDRTAIINFLAGLAFYSFLLLPSAMKFDFRRDYDHLLLLKMLPISPWRIVLGQLSAPVIITTLFQYALLVLANVVRGMDFSVTCAAIVSFPVMNLAIYSWENLLFLLYPQRLKQEGLEVFLRTTIIFTAKGLAFAILFALVVVWAMMSNQIASRLSGLSFVLVSHQVIFLAGVWISLAALGLTLSILAARRFEHLDPAFGQ